MISEKELIEIFESYKKSIKRWKKILDLAMAEDNVNGALNCKENMDRLLKSASVMAWVLDGNGFGKRRQWVDDFSMGKE